MLTFQRIALWGLALSGGRKEWNPVMAGGMSLAGEPQTGVFSLSMILSHFVPPVVALKLAACCFLAAGWVGTYLLARRYGFGDRACLLAASLFIGNGYFLARFAVGHLNLLASLCLPLWLLGTHASLRGEHETAAESIRRLLVLGLSFGALFAISCDGAPFSILLVAVWVGLDALVLAAQRRSVRPLGFLLVALVAGSLLDAIYVFPMVRNQFFFPRVKQALFVNPLVFLFFLLVPVRGHPLPAPAMGYEFSVYIGPVLVVLLLRHRRSIVTAVPTEDRRRLLAVSIVVLVLGLGSWFFAPLAALPGFRTVDLPARFWGFLALPCALFGALAIRKFEEEETRRKQRIAVSAGLLVSLLGYALITLPEPFLLRQGGAHIADVQPPGRLETIANVLDPIGTQAATILPTRGLIHAYADYVRGDISAGSELIHAESAPANAHWQGWNDIQLTVNGPGPAAHVVFNQNFHPFWSSSQGTVSRTAAGNLAVDLPALPAPTRISLRFRDPSSALGQRVTWWTAVLLPALILALQPARLRKFYTVLCNTTLLGTMRRDL